MATLYVRTSGLDGTSGHDGTTPAKAWLTIGYAVTHMAAGDTCWIGGGVYRVSASIAPSSMASMTYLRGDTDGSHTGDAGEVVVTNYATNDTTAPAAVYVFSLASRSYWTISGLSVMAGSTSGCISISGTTANVTVQDCHLWAYQRAVTISSLTFGTAHHILVDRCSTFSVADYALYTAVPASASGADYDPDIVFRSVSVGGPNGGRVIGTANTFRCGGPVFYNCSWLGTSFGVLGSTANPSATYPAKVYNSLICASTGLQSFAAGGIVSDYNVIVATTPLTNVTQGAHDVIDGSRNWRMSIGHEASYGAPVRPFGEPVAGSPLLSFGSAAGVTEDIAGNPRPGSGAASAAGAVGAFERANSGTRDDAVYHTAAPSLKIAGPGVHEWDCAVSAAATTITAWVRWDGSYTGAKPSISVRSGGECGVADATAAATGSASAWEQLTLTFTPTAAGVVTLRFTSSDTSGAGSAWVDDPTVSP